MEIFLYGGYLNSQISLLGEQQNLAVTVVHMAVTPSEAESSANRNLLSFFYSDYLRNRFSAIHFFSPTNFLSNLTSPFRSFRRRECLPLPLPSKSLDSSM
jgi:nuclear-control-of-ATPase protein 2